jgi:hypothetical protein
MRLRLLRRMMRRLLMLFRSRAPRVRLSDGYNAMVVVELVRGRSGGTRGVRDASGGRAEGERCSSPRCGAVGRRIRECGGVRLARGGLGAELGEGEGTGVN